MQHNRPVAVAVLGHIFGVQPVRQHEIHLQRATLPVTANGVTKHEFQFRAIERALARVQHSLKLGRVTGIGQRGFSAVPHIILTGAHFRPVREFHANILKPEIGINRLKKLTEDNRFSGDLVLGAEDMRVILRKGANPHDAVKRTGRLVPVA